MEKRKLSGLTYLNQADYWEVREGHSKQNSILVTNGNVKEIGNSVRSGLSVRVLFKGSWGFSYSETETPNELAKKALKLAKLTESNKKTRMAECDSKNIKKRIIPKINPDNISTEEIVSLLKRKHRETKTNKFVRNTGFEYQNNRRNISYRNSLGIDSSQELLYTTVGTSIGSKLGNKTEQYDARIGKQTGFEIVKNDFSEMVKSALKISKDLLKAKVPKGGNYPVVCDPVLVDVLIHEAFGHATEADGVLKGESCLGGMIGQRLCDDTVTIADDPSIPNSWGSYFFDDEGVKSRRANLVNKGILEGYMHSRETAAALGFSPTGHGRAESTSTIPAVRMSNTILETGSYEENELFEGIKNGMYLCGSSGGQVDVAKGNYQFNAKYGYKIVNGKLSSPIKGVSLSGNTLNMLQNIEKIGKIKHYGMPGFCGKYGQMVPVVGINPKVKLKEAMVGGSQ